MNREVGRFFTNRYFWTSLLITLCLIVHNYLLDSVLRHILVFLLQEKLQIWKHHYINILAVSPIQELTDTSVIY